MLTDIKDSAPNSGTVRILKNMLEQAEKGELRSVLIIQALDDDSVNHSWSIDKRNSWRRILAELMICQHDAITTLGLIEGDSTLAEALE